MGWGVVSDGGCRAYRYTADRAFHRAYLLARHCASARVFVASYGNDSNPCTFLSPCKTFQQAVNVVNAGGEVTAIDHPKCNTLAPARDVAGGFFFATGCG
jgi:hypothetical protein